MFRGHVLKELSVYLDNQLSEARKSQIEKHLQDCRICSQELSMLKLLSEKLKTWQAPNLEASFDSSVRNEIVSWELKRSEVKMKKKTLAILIPSSALAGILLLVFLGSYMSMAPQIAGRYKGQGGKEEYKPHYLTRKYGVGSGFGGSSYTGSSYGRGYATGRGYAAGELALDKLESELESKRQALSASLDRGFSAGGYSGQAMELPGNYAGPVVTSGEGSVIVIQPILPATGEGEKIIRTAQVNLEVEDGKETYKKAAEICKEFGGYLAASNFYKDAEGRESGTITMRIPKDKFNTALDRLSALGKVDNIYTDSQDVGQEYVNLKAQLDATMVVYNKMLEALQKRQTTIPEAMRLESELTPILRRIEGLKNKLEYLNNAVSFTTITLNFHEPKVSAKVLRESRRFIQQSLITTAINTVKFIAKAIPVVIILVIWLAIAFGIVAIAKYWIIRIFKRG